MLGCSSVVASSTTIYNYITLSVFVGPRRRTRHRVRTVTILLYLLPFQSWWISGGSSQGISLVGYHYDGKAFDARYEESLLQKPNLP